MIPTRWYEFIRLLFTAVLLTINMALGYISGQKVRYGVPTDCIGKHALNFLLTTKDNMTAVGCALQCVEIHRCMLFFYSSKTGSCSFHNGVMADLEMVKADSYVCFLRDDVVDAWAVAASVSSSVSGSSGSNIIGLPNGNAWIPRPDDTVKEFRIRLASEMYIVQISVYELGNYGAVEEISLLNPDGVWSSVWDLQKWYQHRQNGASHIVLHDIQVTNFKTSEVKAGLGVSDETQQIDAIMVRGYMLRLSRSDNGPKLIEDKPSDMYAE